MGSSQFAAAPGNRGRIQVMPKESIGAAAMRGIAWVVSLCGLGTALGSEHGAVSHGHNRAEAPRTGLTANREPRTAN